MNATQIVEAYIKEIALKLNTGKAGEHAYRPAFEKLVKDLDPKINPMNDPKRSEHGAPDFVFMRGNDLAVGYAETKDLGEDLDKVEKSEQMGRYFGYSNLILTDYLEFRFYRNGERYGEPIAIGRVVDGAILENPAAFARLANELADFLRGRFQSIKSGAQLAKIMGGKARRIRDNARRFLIENSDQSAELVRVYETVKKLLVHDLTTDKFADMYAQTVVYGLFVARYNDESKHDFTRQEARDLIPASNPFLREFFDHIVGPKFDKRLAYIVDELCAVFSVSDIAEIVHRHLKIDGEKQDEKDPIIHFYEDFLKEYDPAERKKMGAYYTPIPVVKFIVRAVDEALKRDFGLSKGLADEAKRQIMVTSQQGIKSKVEVPRVQVLDPAVGTATFLNEVIHHIHESFAGQQGRWCSYAEAELLPRIYGFELMMAPYTIAHLKLGMTIRETGCEMPKQRLNVYLTNSLEEGVKIDGTLFGFGLSQSIADEAVAAGKIKNEKPIMVVMGNPPYSGVSSNETDYANSLIAKYKVEPGGKEKLKERKHWLNDDYVKFIAFAEEMIERNGEGIVAMITNNGYLDNPTFRGMRWHLASVFDAIHVLDLHGSSKKKEIAPDGGKDENVFDIQQGVAIIVAVKTGNKKSGESARVYHADIFGKREAKFRQLESSRQVDWREISLDKKMLYFVPKNVEGREDYEAGVKISELFGVYNTGILTMADNFIIDASKDVLESRIRKLLAGEFSEQSLKQEFSLGKNYAKWALSNKDAIVFDIHKIVPIVYRPFDRRYTYFDNKLVWRHREKVMRHFLSGQNLGLVSARGTKNPLPDHFFISSDMTEAKLGESSTQSYLFPLYLDHNDGVRTPNFNPSVLKDFTRNLRNSYEPEDVIDYVYANLYSPKYREKYKDFLKSDFPRVTIPMDDLQFHQLASLGKQLRELHLMISPLLDKLATSYPNGGSDIVERASYEDEKIWINKEQYFGNVQEVAWTFSIGGYQPAQKWLKDRKGEKLSSIDIEHYQRIII